MSENAKKKKRKFIIYEPQREYVDRNKLEREIFPNFTITCKDPQTALILLGSSDNEIILNAINYLDKYASKQMKNTEILKDLGIIKIILKFKLYEHNELFIKRFALKLIASIFELENKDFDEITIQEIFHITKNYYENNEDNFIIEYCSVILIEILDEPRLCVTFENDTNFIMNGIYKHLSLTKDPDILYNSYRLLLKIIRCSLSILKICNIQKLPFKRLLGDVSNQYKEIRIITLEVFSEFIECQNEFFELHFLNEIFFNEIFKVLENYEFIDSHDMIFVMFQRLVVVEKYAKYFQMKGYLHRFVSYMKNKNTLEEKLKPLGVLVEIANYSSSLDILYDLGLVDFLIEFVKDKKQEIHLNILLGINRILNHSNAFLKIIENDVTSYLIGKYYFTFQKLQIIKIFSFIS